MPFFSYSSYSSVYKDETGSVKILMENLKQAYKNHMLNKYAIGKDI